MKKNFIKGVLFCFFCSLFLFASFTEKQAVQDETLTIVATVTVKPEFKDDVLKAIKTVVDATRKEPGNIFYDVFEDIKNPLKFVFIETWKSQAAIDSHNKSAHFNNFVKAVEGKATLEASTLRQKF
jgi:CRISPR-associated protein Cas8b1/Cst1 subtype I-B